MSTQRVQVQAVLSGVADRPWLLADVAASVAVFLYVLSLFKFVVRDPLGNDLGFQGPLEALLIGLSFVLSLVACVVRRVTLPSLGALLMLIYALFALLSSVNSFYPSLSAVKGLLLVLTVGIAIGTSSAIGARAVITRFYWSMLAMIGLGLLVSLLLPGIFPLFRVDDTLRNRLWLFNNHPGVVADYVAVLLLLGLIAQPKPPVVFQVGLLMLNFAAGGRSSIVGLVGLLILGYVWNSWQNLGVFVKRSAYLFTILFVSALILGLAILLVEPLRTGVRYLIDRTFLEASSVNGRTIIWAYALSLIRKYPILGLGPDGARDIFLREYVWASNAHNGYLEILLAAGWIGGGAFFLGWLLTMLRVRHLRDRRDLVAVTLIHCYLVILGVIGGLIAPNFTVGLFIIVILAYFTRSDSSYGKIEAR